MEHLSAHTIDIAALLAAAHHPAAGAVVLFSGETRNSSQGREVAYLEYEAQESMAQNMIAAILQQAKERWQLNIALAVHRTGKVPVSGTAVVVITASAHRGEAYTANRFIIDKIKHEAPIWKCEYFTDGSKEWGGNCNCAAITGDAHKHVYEFEENKTGDL
jgi:molybdopterin synthase catalytic subunit